MTTELDRRRRRIRDEIEVHVDMRYVGQEHTLTILLEGDAEQVSGRSAPSTSAPSAAILDEELEIVTFRVIAMTPLGDTLGAHHAASPAVDSDDNGDAPSIDAQFAGERVAFPIRARAALLPGGTIAGPAILTSPRPRTWTPATPPPSTPPALVITKET